MLTESPGRVKNQISGCKLQEKLPEPQVTRGAPPCDDKEAARSGSHLLTPEVSTGAAWSHASKIEALPASL